MSGSGTAGIALASGWKAWHGRAMTDETPHKTRLGGGAPLALLTLAGTIVGGLLGQPSIGFLAGLGLGAVVAVALWLKGPR